jgi:ATP-dependent exoDNAse (exonuclease V) alpha subunit
MHVLLGAVARSNAKLILVGDRRQLQPIGGPGLDLVSRAVEAARVETIVRQRERWAREAVAAFGLGRAAEALDAFAQRGLLIEAHGAKATIEKVLDEAERNVARDQSSSPLILAKSNVAVAAISRSMRERLKAAGRIRGKEVSFKAATPSGHDVELRLARGDRIRFLVRNDDLGLINGTVGEVLKVRQTHSITGRTRRIRVEASVGDRKISFDPMQLADTQGRPRIAWAYAATIHASQGLTVDRAILYVDQSYNRHDILVAASRARDETVLVVDAKAIDKRLTAELPIDRQRDDLAFTEQRRRAWLAERISRASPKVSTWDVIGTDRTIRVERHARRKVAGLSYEPKR